MPGDLSCPSIVPRSLVLGLLLSLSAMLALIAAVRDSRPLFVAAGVLALFHSFIAFSGVTLGFVLPALLLIMLGVSAGSAEPGLPVARRERIGGVLVVGLAFAALATRGSRGRIVGGRPASDPGRRPGRPT
ncbi:MAG: hypothetical protein K0S97_1432 [Chloroflexota bacterium]|jgi:hypothetical protein|nr:hypothetical protein [Chloroflexota bacterium]